MNPLLEDAARRASQYLDALPGRAVAPVPFRSNACAFLTSCCPNTRRPPTRFCDGRMKSARRPRRQWPVDASSASSSAAHCLSPSRPTGRPRPGSRMPRFTGPRRGCRVRTDRVALTAEDPRPASSICRRLRDRGDASESLWLCRGPSLGSEEGRRDVESDGLVGAPPITVVVGAEAHPALFKSRRTRAVLHKRSRTPGTRSSTKSCSTRFSPASQTPPRRGASARNCRRTALAVAA